MTIDASADERLLAPYRVIRRVSGPPESPVAGTLVRAADGEPLLLAPADSLGRDWVGWRVEPGGHVLAPTDIVRRAGHHDVALPVCTERLDAFLERRRAAAVPLGDGEALTLAVSLLRGVAQLGGGEPQPSVWWLTDAGCPVIAPSAGGTDDATADASALLAALASEHDALASALAVAVHAVGSGSMRLLVDAEDELFACTTPAPLELSPAAGTRRVHPLASRALTAEPLETPPARSWLDVVARHVDADLADTVSLATTAAWRRLSRPRTPAKRRPLAVATAVAVIVVGAGLLWPTDSAPTAADIGTGPTSPSPSPVLTSSPTPSDGGGDAAPDLAGIASRLLDARTECAGDAECLAAVVERPDAGFPPGASELPTAARRLFLLEDFGDAAVLRVEAAEGASTTQLLVIIRSNGEWLLRDVHDVAEQP